MTATLFAVPAFAGDKPVEAVPSATVSAPGQRPGHGEMIKRFDQDSDGRLNDAERQTARREMREKWGERDGQRGPGSQMREKMRKRFDRDEDGRLDEAERREARKAMRKMRHRMEHRMMRRQWQHLRGPHAWRGAHAFRGHDGHGIGRQWPMRQGMFRRFDQDGDGKLDEAERGEARKAGETRRAKAQEHRKQVLSRFDGDGDGRLGETERQAMRDAWRKFIEQQPPLKK